MLATRLCIHEEWKPRLGRKRVVGYFSSRGEPIRMADIFLICVIVIAFLILLVVGLYLLVKYQHPDDKNDAYIPKLVVWLGFVFAGATVLLLPLDVANNEGYAGECAGSSAFVGSHTYSSAHPPPLPPDTGPHALEIYIY